MFNNSIKNMHNMNNMSSQPGSYWDNYIIFEDRQSNQGSFGQSYKYTPAHRRKTLAL